jgi:hypothetical protein
VTLFSVLAGGCRRETPIERGEREYREEQRGRMASASLETMRFQARTDAQMVRANHRNGLGLGIRPEKTELRVGEPFKLHLAYENLAARTPISATTCEGFSLAQEDEATDRSTTVAVPFACLQEDMSRNNNAELQPGELKTAELTIAGTLLSFNHPGRYRITLVWQSFV